MTNHDVVPVRIPSGQDDAEDFEKFLEKASAQGRELIAIMPTQRSDLVLAVFRVSTREVRES